VNIQQLKTQGVDLETKIEELKDINQVLREKDKNERRCYCKFI